MSSPARAPTPAPLIVSELDLARYLLEVERHPSALKPMVSLTDDDLFAVADAAKRLAPHLMGHIQPINVLFLVETIKNAQPQPQHPPSAKKG